MSNTASLEKRIDKIDQRFDLLDKKLDLRFDQMMEIVSEMKGTMTTKADLEDLAISVQNSFREIDERFDHVDRRLDIIENISVGGHERRIENLEDRVRVVETKTGIKKR